MPFLPSTSPSRKIFDPDLHFSTPVCKNNGITLRGQFYQLRIRVPAALTERLGRQEIRLSLRTRSRREALRLGLPLLDRIEKIFLEMRCESVTEQTVSYITQKFHDSLANQFTPSQRASMLVDLTPGQVDRSAVLYGKLHDNDREAVRTGNYAHIEQTLLRFADREGITINKESDNYHLLLQQSLMARMKVFEIKQQRALGSYTYDSILDIGLPHTTATPQISRLTIGELCDKYIAMKSNVDGAWDEHSTKPEVVRALKTFRELIGGDYVMASSINREPLNKYKTDLAMLPKQTLKKYAGKSATELLKMTIPKRDIISKRTLNLQLTWVKAMFEWACINDYITKNYAKGLPIKRAVQDKNSRDECDPYSIKEVQSIFTTLTYDANRPERWWGPLIAAHSCMRLNEVGQLLISDVTTINGVLCFKVDIETEDPADGRKKKKLKTIASKRNIPVHRVLLELGFAEFVKEQRRSGALRLFSKLPQSKRGSGVELGKWYGRTITANLFPARNRLKVFNSFRHSGTEQYTNMADLRDSMQQYLTGHMTGKLDFDRYGSAPMVTSLKVFVDRIDYSLDIEILKLKMKNPVFVRRGCPKGTKAVKSAVIVTVVSSSK